MRVVAAILCSLAIAACNRAGLPSSPELAQLGVGPDTLHVIPLHEFNGGSGGGNKHEATIGQGGTGGLIGDPKAALYGVASYGGDKKCNCGVVFELTPRAPGSSHYAETVLWPFHGSDGAYPGASLLQTPDGSFYGTTTQGGAGNDGVVFKLAKSGSSYSESVVFSFQDGAGGYYPTAPLIADGAGNLYGTTSLGGTSSGELGAAFELKPSKGHYALTVLHAFRLGFPKQKDGYSPAAGLAADASGSLYGTTTYGGTGDCPNEYFAGCGTVYRLAPRGKSSYSYSVIYSFRNDGSDGYDPISGVTIASDGSLYGTTIFGGSSQCGGLPKPYGCGTVYALMPVGSGYSERVIHVFAQGRKVQGLFPGTNLIAGADGFFYGTTLAGGDATCKEPGAVFFSGSGCGVIFRLKPGRSPVRPLYAFVGRKSGKEPAAPLLFSENAVFGETLAGGTAKAGTVFKLTLGAPR